MTDIEEGENGPDNVNGIDCGIGHDNVSEFGSENEFDALNDGKRSKSINGVDNRNVLDSDRPLSLSSPRKPTASSYSEPSCLRKIISWLFGSVKGLLLVVAIITIICVVWAAATGFVFLLLALMPCALYGGIHYLNFHGIDVKNLDSVAGKADSKESAQAVNMAIDYLRSFGVGDISNEAEEEEDNPSAAGSSGIIDGLLFDYENRGVLYNLFVRLPVNFFNACRKCCCASTSRGDIGRYVSVFSCFVMLFLTYYATYWLCVFLMTVFHYLVTKYKFSPGETYLIVFDGAYVGYVFIVFVLAILYLAWSREISRLFTRFENEYLPEYKGNRKFNELGVTFNLVDEFIEQIGGREAIAGMSTTEVSDMFMKKLTIASGVSYSEMKYREKCKDVRKANVFVSHAWRYRFLDVIDALKAHFGSDNLCKTVIWFDLFSNNQNKTDEIEFEWWCGTFQHSIRSIGHTVAVFLPWENPIPLSRAWCLWEIFISQKTKVKFEIAMSPSEDSRFIDMIAKDPDSFNLMLSNVDVAKSTSFTPSDRENIFRVIRSTVGFQKVNEGIIKCIKNTILSRLKTKVEKSGLLSSSIPVPVSQKSSTAIPQTTLVPQHEMALFRSLCLIMKDTGDYHSSLKFALRYTEGVRSSCGSTHPDTFDAYLVLADICLHCQHSYAAIKFVEPIMNHFYNSDDYQTGRLNKKFFFFLRAQHLIGKAYLDIEEHHDLAFCILKDCYEKMRQIDGFDLHCMSIYSDYAAACYKSRKDTHTGARICEEAMKILVDAHAFAAGHPSVMEVTWKKGAFTNSIATLKQVVDRMKIKYGLLHPLTIEYMLLVQGFLDPHEAYRYAKDCHAAGKILYPNNPLHPHRLSAKFFIHQYYRNVSLYFTLVFISSASYVGAVFYAYTLLIHQHDQKQIKPAIILLGFFVGFSYLFLLSKLGVKETDSLKPPNPVELLPNWLRKLSPVISMIFGAIGVMTGVLAFHFFLQKGINAGYYIGGYFSGFFAGYFALLYVTNKFVERNNAKVERFKQQLALSYDVFRHQEISASLVLSLSTEEPCVTHDVNKLEDGVLVNRSTKAQQLDFIADFRKRVEEMKANKTEEPEEQESGIEKEFEEDNELSSSVKRGQFGKQSSISKSIRDLMVSNMEAALGSR
jgi:hypothetical protein